MSIHLTRGTYINPHSILLASAASVVFALYFIVMKASYPKQKWELWRMHVGVGSVSNPSIEHA